MADLNPVLEVGDRIVLIHMEDPYSVRPGTVGTVLGIEKTPFGLGYQYRMLWDNGSNLSMAPELDSWVLKSDWESKKKSKLEEDYKTYEKLYENFILENFPYSK